MSGEVNVWSESRATGVTDGGAVETAVLTTGGIDTTTNESKVLITGIVALTPGTAATAVIIKVRRGTTVAGVEVGTLTSQVGTAGAPRVVPYHVEDVPGEVAGQQYVVTVTETSATANGTVSTVTCTITTHS